MTTSSTLRNLLITCAVLIVVAVAAYAYLHRTPASGRPGAAPVSISTNTASSTTTLIKQPTKTTVTKVVAPAGPVAPDYRKAIRFDPTIASNVRSVIAMRQATDVALLAKDGLDFNAWLDLAILYKIGGDYHSAEAIWVYVTQVWSTSPIAYNNLADLYQNFLHDPAKAKFYYDAAAKLPQ